MQKIEYELKDEREKLKNTGRSLVYDMAEKDGQKVTDKYKVGSFVIYESQNEYY